MKHLLGLHLDHLRHHRLRDPISHGRHAKDSRAPAVRLRYRHGLDRRRETRPRGHPVPDLVQVALEILLERLDGHPVHPGRALVRPDLLPRLPDSPLRDLERLARCFQLIHPTPPGELPVDRTNGSRTTRPLRSGPITGPSPLLRAGPPAPSGNGYSHAACGICPPHGSPLSPAVTGSIQMRLLQFRSNAADRARATSMPDTAWPISGHPPGSSRNRTHAPVSMSSHEISTRQQWFTRVRLPGPHLTDHVRLFLNRSPRRSSANAA
jgi:hypothetical protein